MNRSFVRSLALLAIGFGAGVGVAQIPRAHAFDRPDVDIAHRVFQVSIDEIRRNVVFADAFTGSYRHALTMADGSQRRIELTPMIHDGMDVVRLADNGGVTYMGPNGTTTNGTLMVQVRDRDALDTAFRRQLRRRDEARNRLGGH